MPTTELGGVYGVTVECASVSHGGNAFRDFPVEGFKPPDYEVKPEEGAKIAYVKEGSVGSVKITAPGTELIPAGETLSGVPEWKIPLDFSHARVVRI